MPKSLNATQGRMPELDMLRGLAVSLVFGFHALGYAYGHQSLPWNGLYRSFDVPASFTLFLPFQFGGSGVAIFFAISGFCIHYFYNDLSSISRFYMRRFLRIVPPYWFLLVLVSAIPFIGIELFGQTLQVQFTSHLFLIHNFFRSTLYGIVPAWWTIAVEFQLYLLYPLVLISVNRWGWNAALLAIGCVELLLRGYDSFLILKGYEGLATWLAWSPLYFWFSWTLGAWAADRRSAHRLLNITPVIHAGFALVYIACFCFRPLSVFLFPLGAFWVSLTLASNTKYPQESAWFAWLAKVGMVSYSFYLITDTILFNSCSVICEVEGHGVIAFVLLLGTFAPTYLLSRCLYARIERPSQELGRKLYRSKISSSQPNVIPGE
jgi:peptidoglycan/LPS O-acetylase OafA/YrhL